MPVQEIAILCWCGGLSPLSQFSSVLGRGTGGCRIFRCTPIIDHRRPRHFSLGEMGCLYWGDDPLPKYTMLPKNLSKRSAATSWRKAQKFLKHGDSLDSRKWHFPGLSVEHKRSLFAIKWSIKIEQIAKLWNKKQGPWRVCCYCCDTCMDRWKVDSSPPILTVFLGKVCSFAFWHVFAVLKGF